MHAGLVPGIPLDQQQLNNLFKMRHVAKTGNGYTACEEGEALQPWAAVWEGPQHVFFGHDAKRRLQDLPSATGA